MFVYLMHISLVEVIQCDHIEGASVSLTTCENGMKRNNKFIIVMKNYFVINFLRDN